MTDYDVHEANIRRWVADASARNLALVLDVIAGELESRRIPGAAHVTVAAQQVRLCGVADRAAGYAVPIHSEACAPTSE